ncbi:MAG TPA: hypothetical protein VIY68_14215, partial [Steroidobacteraceae bacterium]
MSAEEADKKYEGLTREQLVQLIQKRDRQKKLGLVWERDEIEADNAVDANFVACALLPELCERKAPWRNLVIEGDNFDALRWLRIGYAGRVKCIYIDAGSPGKISCLFSTATTIAPAGNVEARGWRR